MLVDLDQLAQTRARKPVYLDALTRSDYESELEAWMDEQNVEKCLGDCADSGEPGLSTD